MTEKQTILLIGNLDHALAEWRALDAKFNLKHFSSGGRADFLTRCESGEFQDVVGLYRSNISTSETGPFDAELINALPKKLKYICHNGAGYDNIDVAAATKRGIMISSTPVAVDNATADAAIFLMLGALRKAMIPLTALRSGQWRGSTPIGHDPEGKILGILGMGGIGRAVAHRAKAFGMQIMYHNRTRLSEELEAGAKYCSFDELLAKSDVISLNLSLNANTRHIIAEPEFQKMKDGVVIVNTARGALIKEHDLCSALKSSKVASAGLDVYEREPEIDEDLRKDPNVFLLPHIGTNTYETQKQMELLVLRNLQQAVEGRGLVTPIPEQRDV